MVRKVLLGFAVVAGAVLISAAPPAAAAPTHVNGPCEGSGTFASNGRKVPASEEGTVTVPLKDAVKWEGSITGPDEKAPYDGEIVVEMPPPFPDVVIDSWSGDTDSTQNGGVKKYDLPSWVPRGVALDVTGSHDQQGFHCDGHVTIEIDGGPFDSPAAPASLLGTVVTGAAFAFAGRAKGAAA